jgi:hypothetical protein
MLDNYAGRERGKRRNSECRSDVILAVVERCPLLRRSGVKEDHTANWFNHGNAAANQSREQLAHDSLEMLIQWLKDGGNVGIHGNFFFCPLKDFSDDTCRCDE